MTQMRRSRRPTLRELRELHALSLSDLAERSGVDRMTIHRIERGKQTPHPATKRKIAEALQVAVERVDWKRQHEV